MNHYDDRQSYFALLNEKGMFASALYANGQQDVSMSAYGGSYSGTFKAVVTIAELQAEV